MGLLKRIKKTFLLTHGDSEPEVEIKTGDKPAGRKKAKDKHTTDKETADKKAADKQASDKEVADSLLAFKMAMLKYEPFYGDVLMRLNIIADRSVPTACTNGRWIRYNPDFMASMDAPRRNYVLMHEMLHVVLKHWKRQGTRDPGLWNIACDLVVNSFIDRRMSHLRADSTGYNPYGLVESLMLKRPKKGIFSSDYYNRNAEDVYQELYEKNKDNPALGKNKKFRVSLGRGSLSPDMIPDDLIIATGKAEAGDFEEQLAESLLDQILKDAISKAAGRGRCPIPDVKIALAESKRLPWDRILSDFFESRVSEESSYFTPERKYLHMDMIVPGLGSIENELTELWAFVDSSGSIGINELGQFLTQLSRIAKQFNSVINLAYWDTEVGRVYKNIKNTQELLKAMPDSSGGTDVNCVYRYINENKIKPGVLLILTDGYFGECRENVASLKKKTIIVLSESSDDREARKLGRVADLKRA